MAAFVDDCAREIETELKATPTEGQSKRVRDSIRRLLYEDRKIHRRQAKERLGQMPHITHNGVEMVSVEDALKAIDPES